MLYLELAMAIKGVDCLLSGDGRRALLSCCHSVILDDPVLLWVWGDFISLKFSFTSTGISQSMKNSLKCGGVGSEAGIAITCHLKTSNRR